MLSSIKFGLVITISFIFAIMLTLLPLPGWTVWLKPAWVMLVLFYWVLVMPDKVNVTVAWIVGLMVDVVSGTFLGAHAFAMVILAYFIYKLHRRMRVFPLLQQTLTVLGFMLVYQLIIFTIQGIGGDLPHTWLFWLAPLTSALFWPWVSWLLQDIQERLALHV